MNLREFHSGEAFDAYRFFGAHRQEGGFIFRTWAPNARSVALVGDFNGWSAEPMERQGSGVWTAFIPGACPGQRYQYELRGQKGCKRHCDPYGFGMELRPGACSVIRELGSYEFTDRKWMRSRSKCFDRPMNIYELHLGSWIKNGWQWHSYTSVAQPLIEYLTENGYTHVELMPLSEHSGDGSWGYLTTGFFAPTSRYGTPDQLRELIDRLHSAGIGVILDFVLVHFAVDGFGLGEYDGGALYEIPREAGGLSEWGSHRFDFSRGEVASFVKSCAHYWLKEFHFDGLRMDAVSRLIYHGGEANRGEDQTGIRFLRELNRGLRQRHKSAMLIAEDSSAWPGVTGDVEAGGLGFDYKWNMGWMYDTLQYLERTPEQRRDLAGQFAFSIHYAWNERYILSISHDEEARGRRGLMQRLPGTKAEKLAQARLFFLYMMTHPGKKLRFMGLELGTEAGWDFGRELPWTALGEPEHQSLSHFVAELNGLYRRKSALWRQDLDGAGFLWLNCRCVDPRMFGYARRDGGAYVLVLMNFSDREVSIDPDWYGSVRMLLHTDWECFGGSTRRRGLKKMPSALPPYSGAMLEFLC